jgi:hypothetical protein
MTTKAKVLIGALWASSLVIASAGAGLASTLITGKQIKDESITGRDIRNGSIHQIDLAPNVSAVGLVGLQLVTKVEQPPPSSGPPSYGLPPSTIVARCPRGKKVVGGGYNALVGTNVNRSQPAANLQAWLVEVSGGFAPPPPPYGTGNGSRATAYAICVKAR